MSESSIQGKLLTGFTLILGVGLGLSISGLRAPPPSPPPQPGLEQSVTKPAENSSGAETNDEAETDPSDTPGSSSPAGTPSLQEVFQTAGRVAALRSALAALDPPSELWPDEIPKSLSPEAFEEGVEAALDAVGQGELAAMNCDEYPCVATLFLPIGEEPVGPSEGLATLMQVRQELSEILEIAVDAHLDTHPSGVRLTLGAHPDGIVGVRLQQRLEEAWLLASH